MNNYFEAKAKYVKIDETSGKEKKVTETYLVDAMSLTEMEARTVNELQQCVSGDFNVVSGKESNISEIFPNEDGDRWFKAKVLFVDIDEVSGRERKTNQHMLIRSNNVDEAYAYLKEKLSDMIVPFEIPSVSESQIIDVFQYFEED